MANLDNPHNGRSRRTSKVTSATSLSGTGLSLDDKQITDIYNDSYSAINYLAEEVKFTISDALSIIPHYSLEVRVKELTSTLKKFRDKNYTDFAQLTDLVGARVICNFRSDLEDVKKAIESSFDIEEFDDKALEDPNKFGYMSLHFLCRIKDAHSGPRYDRIKGRTFEIQVRTICMHAWSSIQHSLEYKGEWDVPAELKKDINALSALFYLADTQFEAVFKAKSNALNQALQVSKNSKSQEFHDQEVNLETLTAYAASKFPTRKSASKAAFSTLMHEIHQAGYETIGQINADIERALPALKAEEKNRPDQFNLVGALRICLSYASKEFEHVTYGSELVNLKNYQELVNPLEQ